MFGNCVRIVGDKFEAPLENRECLIDIIEQANLNEKITVEEKMTSSGTVLIGLYEDCGEFRLMIAEDKPITGRLYLNGIEKDKLEEDILFTLFVNTAYVLKLNGEVKIYQDNGEQWYEIYKDGIRYRKDEYGEQQEITNTAFDEYLHKQIINGKINIMLDRLNELINSKADESEIHSVKAELKQLHSQLY